MSKNTSESRFESTLRSSSQRFGDQNESGTTTRSAHRIDQTTNHRIASPTVAPTEGQLRSIADTFYAQLSIARYQPRRCSLAKLAKVYAKTHLEVADLRAQIDSLLTAIVRAAVIHRPQSIVTQQEKTAVIEEKVSELVRQTGIHVPSMPHLFRAEHTLLPAAELAFQLRLSAQSFVEELVTSIPAHLERLAQAEIVGTLDWFDTSVCRLQYFTFPLIHEVDARRATRRVENQIEYTCTDSSGRVLHRKAHAVHDLIEARSQPIPTYFGNLPYRVQPLIAAIPLWLRPYARIVYGQIVYQRTVEQDIRRKRWKGLFFTKGRIRELTRYHRDPAVVIGTHVLVGWDCHDEPTPSRGFFARARHEL